MREHVEHWTATNGALTKDPPLSAFFRNEEVHHMQLENQSRQKREGTDAMSPPRAEIISRAWQAVAFIEEMRSDLTKQVRESPAREQSAVSLTAATQHLVIAATLLVPGKMVRRARHDASDDVGDRRTANAEGATK